MVSGPEEEFVNFLEFEDLQLNFQFEGAPQDGRELQPEADGGMDTSMGSGGAEVMRLENGQVQQQMDHCSPMPVMNGYHGAPDSFHHINYPGELFNQHHPPHLQMQYRGQNIVPPTPNSIEMHAEQPHYYRPSREDHRHVMYDHAGRNQKDQVHIGRVCKDVAHGLTPI